jgi:hypothetical protein
MADESKQWIKAHFSSQGSLSLSLSPFLPLNTVTFLVEEFICHNCHFGIKDRGKRNSSIVCLSISFYHYTPIALRRHWACLGFRHGKLSWNTLLFKEKHIVESQECRILIFKSHQKCPPFIFLIFFLASYAHQLPHTGYMWFCPSVKSHSKQSGLLRKYPTEYMNIVYL